MFHDSNPSEPLINRLKYFHIRFLFCQDIQIGGKSGMRMTPLSQEDKIFFEKLQCGMILRSLIPTEESGFLKFTDKFHFMLETTFMI